ncbi:CTD kinase subunit gamma CTK3-domain-containing protein [Hygrophoropsis aurantiaca]|uniref:CTD kinase subunit gamma CTK3-domain-containing protein n=1 Tax=Hygrophoropsis aurantiaca TaxID=72124 RepID=A0ACB8A8U8_9AGAM|nr:CTD kinase subunit gamma CTK3-domain-containing protein [Hygrophoropsis aurantiaca]
MNTMDPFEVRMQFLSLLRKLNATQQSIQKVVSYALKYFSRCGEDLWDCIVEECQKGTVNHRINVLYFLDSLCEAAAVARVHALESSGGAGNMGGGGAGSAAGAGASKQYMSFYVDFVARDLEKIVEYVVPQGRQGLPNFTSTKQILESWRSKRVIDPQKVDDAMAILAARQSSLDDPSSSTSASVAVSASLSRNDIFKRIEEDRERHKRLRERRWVQPALPSAFPPFAAASATSDMGTSGADYAVSLTDEHNLALDIEFENEWDATSDWNEDDEEAAGEELELVRRGRGVGGAAGEEPMDLS